MFFTKKQAITDDLIGEDERVCICSAKIAEFLYPASDGQTKEDAYQRIMTALSAQRNPEDGDRMIIPEETDCRRTDRGAS